MLLSAFERGRVCTGVCSSLFECFRVCTSVFKCVRVLSSVFRVCVRVSTSVCLTTFEFVQVFSSLYKCFRVYECVFERFRVCTTVFEFVQVVRVFSSASEQVLSSWYKFFGPCSSVFDCGQVWLSAYCYGYDDKARWIK